MARKAEEVAKGMLWPSVIFEELGLKYFGPIDGHDTATLIKTFEFLKKQDRPVLLHVLTQKGKGFEPAIAEAEEVSRPWSLRSRDRRDQAPGPPHLLRSVRRHHGEAGRLRSESVVAITAAMPNGTGLDRFQPHHPEKYFDVGIAEEHAVLFAAGLAAKGFKPVLRHLFHVSAARLRSHRARCLPAKPPGGLLHGSRRPLRATTAPRTTAFSTSAICAAFRTWCTWFPKDEDELADMLFTALQWNGPIAVRYPRGAVACVNCKTEPQVLPIGKAEVLADGTDVAILGLGPMITMARELAVQLESQGFSSAVINPRFIKPIDREMLAQYSRRVAAFVTFEDHVKMGGFGSAVIDALQEIGSAVPVVRIGWPDQFIEHGKVEALRAKYGLSAEAAQARVLPLLTQRKRRTLVAS